MNIIVVGIGKVGYTVAEQLTQENHDVTIIPSDITPDVYDFLINQAQPWPHQNSIFIKNDFIIVIYHHQTLQEFKDKVRQLYS